jgi:hypothetical protein
MSMALLLHDCSGVSPGFRAGRCPVRRVYWIVGRAVKVAVGGLTHGLTPEACFNAV